MSSSRLKTGLHLYSPLFTETITEANWQLEAPENQQFWNTHTNLSTVLKNKSLLKCCQPPWSSTHYVEANPMVISGCFYTPSPNTWIWKEGQATQYLFTASPVSWKSVLPSLPWTHWQGLKINEQTHCEFINRTSIEACEWKASWLWLQSPEKRTILPLFCRSTQPKPPGQAPLSSMVLRNRIALFGSERALGAPVSRIKVLKGKNKNKPTYLRQLNTLLT